MNLNIGLSNRDGEMTIFEAPDACWSVDRDLLTGYFEADESKIVEHSIKIETLAEVCDRHVSPGTTIDFLKVDVEGHEREVLEGGDFGKWRPRIILAESNGYETWESLLLDSGYSFTLFDGVNRFYVRDEDAELIPLLSSPANASDSFLIYGSLRRIQELEESIRQSRDLHAEFGPLAFKVARQIGRASKRFPTASRFAKNVFRSLGRGA